MIIASRIPALTEKMRAATLAAARARQLEKGEAPDLHPVHQTLEQLGYIGRIERPAA